jgi:uncharacterized protein YkwD
MTNPYRKHGRTAAVALMSFVAVVAPTATPAAAAGDLRTLVSLVNSERAKAGCAALTVDRKLGRAARGHSRDMAAHGRLSHRGSDGSTLVDRYARVGYAWSAGGENIASGYPTPEAVMAGWMDSDRHRANLLNCRFKEIGVGRAGPGDYWTQDFGTAR